MRKSSQILAAVAVAGMAMAGSTAFTGTGLTNNAGESQFIGGTVTQSVSGATLDNVTYQFFNAPANTAVSGMVLHFADQTAIGHNVTVVANFGAGTFNCLNVQEDVSNTAKALCSFDQTSSTAPGYTGQLTSIDITVLETTEPNPG